MFNMRNQRYTLPGLLVILCFPAVSASPPMGGTNITEVEKDKNSWDECKELLKKTKKKKEKKKDSPKKED